MEVQHDKNWQESETLEFKASLSEREDAGKTLVAFANKDGGVIYFGVENDGKINGLHGPSEGTIRQLEQLFTDNTEPKLCPKIEKITQDDKLIIRVEVGKSSTPYHAFRGHAYIRIGLSDRKMSQEEHHSRWMEYRNNTYDFSAEICKDLSFEDLDISAIEMLKMYWSKKEQNEEYMNFSAKEVLQKLLLIRDDKCTYAVLLLCGKTEKITQSLPEAEIRFGWKNDPKKLDFDFQKDWRSPFLTVFDEIWDTINIRNIRYPYEQGFFEGDIWAFDQKSVREGVLNAFAHRNYQERGSIFIDASTNYFTIRSPGKFLSGVSPDNILDVQGKWRNRLLMETLGKIGLVERYGHGLDRIFSRAISEGKGRPKIEELSSGQVQLQIPTQVKDEKFIVFLTNISKQNQISFDMVKDLLFLNDIRENQFSNDIERREKFLKFAIIEKIGKGRGTKYILSSKMYEVLGQKAEYIRKKWFAKDEQKELLWKFFKQHKKGRMKDFKDLFEAKLNNHQILKLLWILKAEDKIFFDGKQRSPSAFWKIKE